MLSKEEIEKAKDILVNIIADEVIGTYCIEIQKEINCSENCKDKECYLTQAIDTTLKYINELDSREQKLIEKLEEESKQLEHDILTMSIDTGNNYSLKLINEAKGMKKQNDRILEILKKE